MAGKPVDAAQVPGEPEPRPVNLLLILAVLAVPILFVWLLLLPGYARSTRIAAFTYAFGYPLVWAVSLVAIELSRR